MGVWEIYYREMTCVIMGISTSRNLQSRPISWGPKEPDMITVSRPSMVEPERSSVVSEVRRQLTEGPHMEGCQLYSMSTHVHVNLTPNHLHQNTQNVWPVIWVTHQAVNLTENSSSNFSLLLSSSLSPWYQRHPIHSMARGKILVVIVKFCLFFHASSVLHLISRT